MISPFFQVLENRGFRRLWLAQITSQIALNMLTFVLTIQIYEHTKSTIAVSLMLLSYGIPAIIFGVLAGSVVDLFDKRKILIFCNISRVFVFILFFFFYKNLPGIYLLVISISILTQLFIPAEGPSIPGLVKSKQLLSANSLFTISFYISTVVGFIVAGPMLRVFGDRFIFIFMAFMMALATYFVMQLPKLTSSPVYGTRFNLLKLLNVTIDGLKFIANQPRVRQALLLMTFSQALISTLAVLAPGFADKVLSIDLADASYLVMGPAALGLVIGAFFVGRYGGKILKGTYILTGILACGVILILLSITTNSNVIHVPIQSAFGTILDRNILIAFILLVLLGVSNSMVSVPANTILLEDSETELRGRVYGVLSTLTGGVSLLPVIFSGVIADIAGVSVTILILGVAVLSIGIYQFWVRNRTLMNGSPHP